MNKHGKKLEDRALDPIGLGTLFPGSTPIDVSGRTWRFGLAMTESGQQAVFACACEWRELFVQAVVSSIGRALDLPIPPCFILLATRETFPERDQDGSFFIFACQSGAHPTMAAFARRMSEAVDMLTSAKRETTNRLIVLDEWAHNGRRASTAVLVATAAGLPLIAHHPSLENAIAPAGQLRYWVFDVANAQMTELDARRLRKEMEASAGKVFEIDLGILADQASGLGKPDQVDAWLKMLDFMAERRHHLEDLFCQRLGIPEQRLSLAS
jgi:hypothetical protein